MHVRTIFYHFGPPRILQTDDGGEFIGHELHELLQEFPNTQHIRSRARHPQSQGLIERANQTLENKIGGFLQDNPTKSGWANALPRLIYDINTSYSRIIQTTPFEVMFARKPLPVVQILQEEIDPMGLDLYDSVDPAGPGPSSIVETNSYYLLFEPISCQAICIGI